MASAWGDSFGVAWGDSWGAAVVAKGGGSSSYDFPEPQLAYEWVRKTATRWNLVYGSELVGYWEAGAYYLSLLGLWVKAPPPIEPPEKVVQESLPDVIQVELEHVPIRKRRRVVEIKTRPRFVIPMEVAALDDDLLLIAILEGAVDL